MATSGQVTSYDYQILGGADGYAGNRAIIRLYGVNGTLAYVHVVPAGNPIPGDTDSVPWMRMYVPESQFANVIDMLRNEGPISVYYASGSGFLHTGSEPIGEGE
jgi:hypothetical protein